MWLRWEASAQQEGFRGPDLSSETQRGKRDSPKTLGPHIL